MPYQLPIDFEAWYKTADVDYTTNAQSYYESLARNKHFLKLFTDKMIEINNGLLKDFDDFKDLTTEQIKQFNDRLNGIKEEMKEFFNQWLADGVLDEVINQDIFNNLNDLLKEKKSVLNSKVYGAVGDGITDDTESFKRLLTKAKDGNIKHIYIEDGDYLLSVDINSNSHLLYGILEIPSDTIFEMAPNARLIVKPSSSTSYNLLTVKGSKNVLIKGGQLIGDREAHTGTTGEWGYGIALVGCENVKIENVRIEKMWGDGINLQYSEEFGDCTEISINHVKVVKSRRNGLSIESAKNVTVKNSFFYDTGGIAPQCGIDVEPWTTNSNCENVLIENCFFERNKANHILLHNNKKGITINNCRFGDSTEYSIYALNGIVDLLITNNTFTNSGFWQVITSDSGMDNKTIISNNLFKSIVRTMTLAKNTLFTDNIIDGNNTKIGLITPAQPNITIKNNVFKNADYGIFVSNKHIDGNIYESNQFENVITCIHIINTVAGTAKNVSILNNQLNGFSLAALNLNGLTNFIIKDNIIMSEKLTSATGYYYGFFLSGPNKKGTIASNLFLSNSTNIKLRYGIYSDTVENTGIRLISNVFKGGVTTKDGEIFMIPNVDVEKYFNVVTE